jgi:hypothetical protein
MALPLEVPPGYGFRPLLTPELRERPSLLDVLLIFEQPRRGPQHRSYRYVIAADVADGIGQDRSSVDVIRTATLDEPAEQVAHFLSDSRTPTQLAYVIDALGHLYRDDDAYEACVAVELNNHGLATQEVLQLHLGYPHFYRWEIVDAADQGKRFTQRIGWTTTNRTRPILLSHFHEAITTLDPTTGFPDLRLNSPYTIDELADFQTEGALWEAAAARGAHDDCILSAAIGYYVAWKLSGGEHEPLNDRRRRKAEMAERQKSLSAQPRDWRNSAFTTDEMKAGELDEDWDTDAPSHDLYR